MLNVCRFYNKHIFFIYYNDDIYIIVGNYLITIKCTNMNTLNTKIDFMMFKELNCNSIEKF